MLSSFTGGAKPPAFPQAQAAAIGRVLGVPAGIVVGLAGQVTLSSTAALALQQLDRAAQLASTLGLDGATLGALATDDYDKLSAAADALVLALGARYTDPKTQASKLDAAEQPIRAAKRDALVDYLTRTPPYAQRWSTSNDLYEYFLIDVAAGGCASTSWVVSATMSAQLYVYRAIMNLRAQRGSRAVRPELRQPWSCTAPRRRSGSGGRTTGCGRPTARCSSGRRTTSIRTCETT